jgi:hypothetical protein
MACKYYDKKTGLVNELLTDLYGYMDTVQNKNVDSVYKILKKHRIATKRNDIMYLTLPNVNYSLREFKRIERKHPGLFSTEYIKMTPRSIYSEAAPLYSLTINKNALENIKPEGTANADISTTDQVDIDQYVRFVAGAERNTRDYYLDEIARRENTSNSKFSAMEKEDMENVYRVSNELKNSFAKAGITIDVVFDTSIDNIGQVDPAELGMNPRIRINPLKVRKDTTYHEFGHIYIDLLGINDPIVSQAIAELRDTDLYYQVKEAYPELYGEMLDKEVLATAIGLEGAKLVRKNPNKLQRILNRLFRAIGKLFGITPNNAARLAEEMFAGKLRRDSMINPLSSYIQASKEEVKLKELVDEARVRINSEIYELNQLPEDQVSPEEKITLLRLENSLQRVRKVEDLFKLVDAMGGALARAKSNYRNIMELPEGERGTTANLNKMWALKKTLDGLEMFSSIKSLLLATKDKGKIQDLDAFDKLEDRVNEIIDQATVLDNDFKDDIIPVWAQSVIGLSNKNLPAEIQKLIDNIEKNKRLVGPDTTDIAWVQLTERYNKGQITEEELTEKRLKLNVEQLKQKQLLNYGDLVKELTTAHKDKSGYSFYFDPIVYSSDRGIQLLVKAVQQANLEKNDLTLDLKSKLAPVYDEFAAGQSESNVEKLNDDLLEEVTINGVKRLALVNPIDQERYYGDLRDYKKQLDEKYSKPKPADFNDDMELYKIEYGKWIESSKGRNYQRDIVTWNNDNSTPIEGWEKELKRVRDELKVQQSILKQLKANGFENTDSYLNAQINRDQLNKFLNKNYINGKPAGDWVQPDPKVYTNAKYTTIQNDPRLKKYYDFVLQEFQTAQRMIGVNRMDKNTWDKYSYLMPTYRKEDYDRAKENGTYNTIKDMLQDGFTIQETNHDYYTYNQNNKDIEKRVPVYATNRVPAREVSKDIASSLYRFRHMAHNFKTKSEILGQVMVFQEILKNAKTLETNSAGIQLIQKAAESMGINMPKLKEGETYNFKHVNEWIDSVMFGQSNLQKDFTVFGKTFSANEAVGTINAFTAMSTLSFNLLQGANQSILDNMMMLQESFAGQFLSKSDMAWAKGKYWGSGMAMTDIGRFDPKSKIAKAVEYFDALTEFTDTEGNQIVGGKRRKAARTGNLLFLQQAAEHELSATRMLGLMKNLEGTLKDSDGNVILNEDGKPANLYDLLIIDEKTGKMSIDPRLDEKQSGFNRLDFITKLQGLSRRTNQIKGKMHTNMLQRRWWGKLFMLFRNWMPPGIRRRYGHGGGSTVHVDEELGAVTQGMYVSFWNFIAESISTKSFAYTNMTEMEQQNVKRTSVELASLMGAMALVAALSNLDDEDESWITNFALYQAKRYQTEIKQWTPLPGAGLSEAFRILQSPTATARPILKGGDLLGQLLRETRYILGDPFIDDSAIFYQRKTGRFQKGDRKIRKDFEDLLPIFRGLQKSRTPEEAYKWFTTLE